MNEDLSGDKGADIKFSVRNSMKIIRRDGTVEERPGEWTETTEEEAVSRFGTLESFARWLNERKENR